MFEGRVRKWRKNTRPAGNTLTLQKLLLTRWKRTGATVLLRCQAWHPPWVALHHRHRPLPCPPCRGARARADRTSPPKHRPGELRILFAGFWWTAISCPVLLTHSVRLICYMPPPRTMQVMAEDAQRHPMTHRLPPGMLPQVRQHPHASALLTWPAWLLMCDARAPACSPHCASPPPSCPPVQRPQGVGLHPLHPRSSNSRLPPRWSPGLSSPRAQGVRQ